MSTLNAQIFINAFSDATSSNAPSLQNVRWCRNVANLLVANPVSQSLVVPAGQTVTIISQATPKRFLYLESDQSVSLSINSNTVAISTLVTGTNVQPALYLGTAGHTAVTVHNAGLVDANVFVISAE